MVLYRFKQGPPPPPQVDLGGRYLFATPMCSLLMALYDTISLEECGNTLNLHPVFFLVSITQTGKIPSLLDLG
jgi:hypothetical protein